VHLRVLRLLRRALYDVTHARSADQLALVLVGLAAQLHTVAAEIAPAEEAPRRVA
jgi:hypothetical protein